MVRIRCDVSTSGSEWTLDDIPSITNLLSGLGSGGHTRWLFTSDELQLDDLPMEDAIHIARGLVDVTTAGRLRPGSERQPGNSNTTGLPIRHHTPMERSDWNGQQR